MQNLGEESKATKNEAMAKGKTLMERYSVCDRFLQNFQTRKEARAAEVARTYSQTCPSTSFVCDMAKDAGGNTVFVPHELPGPHTCVNVAAELPKVAEFKICGLGSFSFSAMSCDIQRGQVSARCASVRVNSYFRRRRNGWCIR